MPTMPIPGSIEAPPEAARPLLQAVVAPNTFTNCLNERSRHSDRLSHRAGRLMLKRDAVPPCGIPLLTLSSQGRAMNNASLPPSDTRS